jgi:hypothetical protein
MTKKLLKFAGKHAGFVATILCILLFIAIEALSWIITCGLIKLITICFGWTYSWGMATGIWLIMSLARSVFKSTTTVKK